MKPSPLFMFAAIVMFATGCASIDTSDIKVRTDADPKVKFSAYKAYAWLGSAKIINDPKGKWEPPKFDADAEIKHLIDIELRKRDMLEKSSKPDLIVAFAAGVDMAALKLKENPETKLKDLKNIPQGALVIILVDADTGYVVWVATAVGEVQRKQTTEEARKRLAYAVSKMFDELPK